MSRILFTLFITMCIAASSSQAKATSSDVTYRIYLDQDLTVERTASRSIVWGLKAALANFDPTSIIPGKRVNIELRVKDHKTNIFRSKLHLKEFQNDPNALAVWAGYYSPPLIRYREFINENRILTLVPWAAGGGITRTPRSENWVFRLSVDDWKAGKVIAEYAAKNEKCANTHLLLIDNPWGASNSRTLRAGLSQFDLRPASQHWMPWQMTASQAEKIVKTTHATSSDCILLVGDADQSVKVIKAIAVLPKSHRPTVLSHWGLTTGNFERRTSHQDREAANLKFIQSCHNLSANNPHLTVALDALRQTSKASISDARKIPAPAGFVHSYDLARVLLAAMREANLTGDISTDRRKLRHALENIRQPVAGIIKTYRQPFRPYLKDTVNAHEALTKADLCLASFDKDNVIRVELKTAAPTSGGRNDAT